MQTNDRVKTGDRVKSNEDFDPVPHEGTVHAITCGVTSQGFAPIFSVLVDMRDGKACEPHLHETSASFWNKVGVTAPEAETPKSDPTCPTCGTAHGRGPFTPEMFSLVEKFQALPKEADERESILSELAERFRDQVNATNYEVPDVIHKLIHQTDKAYEKALQLQLQLGRIVIRNIVDIQLHNAGRSNIRRMFLGGEPEKKPEEGLN